MCLKDLFCLLDLAVSHLIIIFAPIYSPCSPVRGPEESESYMTKKIISLLLCLSSVALAHTPIHHHRVKNPTPDPVVKPAQVQERVAEILAAAHPLGTAAAAAAVVVTEQANSLISTAMKYIGTRYSMGSSGPKSFDCSGFTSYVFGKQGISIRRTSREQFAQGEEITDVKDLQKGDLVFFGHRGGRGKPISHVGIVTDVDAEKGSFNFIHASRRGVIVDKYPDASYYLKRYVSACRILGTE